MPLYRLSLCIPAEYAIYKHTLTVSVLGCGHTTGGHTSHR